jgi:hypothetical protein
MPWFGHAVAAAGQWRSQTDGQSADRSDSLQLPLLFLKVGLAGGRPVTGLNTLAGTN